MNPSFSQPSQFNFVPQQSMAVPQIGTFGSQGLAGLSAAAPTAGVSGTQSLFSGLFQQPQSSQFQQPQSSQFPQFPPSGGSQQDPMQQMMQLMLMMMTMLITMLAKKNPTAALDKGGAGAAGAQKTFKPIAAMPINLPSASDVAGKSQGNNVEQNAGERNGLQNSLDKIASDPEGRALLAEAQRRGVTIEVGDPSKAAGAADKIACNCPDHQAAKDQGSVVNGVTISRGNKSHIVVRDPSNIKTIVHELVHAISTQDGNSKHEEGIADVIGRRVESRLTGKAAGDQNTIYTQKKLLYGELGERNGIENSLAAIGISAFA